MDFDWKKFDDAERMGAVKICCEPTRVQYDFPLEAVSLDEDGRISFYPDIPPDPLKVHQN